MRAEQKLVRQRAVTLAGGIVTSVVAASVGCAGLLGLDTVAAEIDGGEPTFDATLRDANASVEGSASDAARSEDDAPVGPADDAPNETVTDGATSTDGQAGDDDSGFATCSSDTVSTDAACPFPFDAGARELFCNPCYRVLGEKRTDVQMTDAGTLVATLPSDGGLAGIGIDLTRFPPAEPTLADGGSVRCALRAVIGTSNPGIYVAEYDGSTFIRLVLITNTDETFRVPYFDGTTPFGFLTPNIPFSLGLALRGGSNPTIVASARTDGQTPGSPDVAQLVSLPTTLDFALSADATTEAGIQMSIISIACSSP